MPDADHSPTFWSSVASAFKSNPDVLFELYNEPYLGQSTPTTKDWRCWLKGCTIPAGSGSWRSAGMQTLVNSVRQTGARQIIIVNGMEWANDLNDWVRFKPTDPLNNIVAGFHDDYSGERFASPAQWAKDVLPVQQAGYPVVATEIDGRHATDKFSATITHWLDQHGISYLGWTSTFTTASNDVSTQLDNHFAELQAQGYT